MTDWTTITDTQLDPKAPVTSELMSAMRDNPIAISEGATGAPKIRAKAAAQPSDLPSLTVTASDVYNINGSLGLVDFTLGDTSLGNEGPGGTYDILKISGSARFSVNHYDSTGGPTGGGQGAFLRLMKNDVEIASWSSYTNTPVTRTADLSITVGDEIKWLHRSTFPSNNNSRLSGFGCGVSDTYLTRNIFDVASNL